jgi:cytochrome c553
MTRPNPITDELSDDAKQELAAIFAALRRTTQSSPFIPLAAWHDRALITVANIRKNCI